MKERIIETLKNDGLLHLYDVIALHYWEMSKEELKSLLLELIYYAQGGQSLEEMIEELESRL